jgi:ketosteroid isomerase-like protein
MDVRVDRIVALFERLSTSDLDALADIYTDDARFKDPFNDVQGRHAIRQIFERMFVELEAPHFLIRDRIEQGDQCFLTWDFGFRMRRLGPAEQNIHGSSHLKLAPDGRIEWHRDYWDAAQELYEKLPLLGALMRWLRRRAAG